MNNRPVITGSLAYKIDFEDAPVKKSLKTTNQKQLKKQEKKRVSLAVLLFYVIIIGAMAFCLIGREVKLYAKSAELSSKQTQLTELQAKSKQMLMDAESELDFAQIEQTAVEKYNMSRPETHQVIYVDMEKNDYIEGGREESAGALQKLLGIIKEW